MDLVYSVLFHPEPEGGFTAVASSLPGCVTYGKTLVQAQKMIMDAISAYIASLKKHGESIPSDEAAFVASVRVARSPKRAKAYAA